jgi:hypothetical protein
MWIIDGLVVDSQVRKMRNVSPDRATDAKKTR